MPNSDRRPSIGLKLHDLIGLVIGYGMAALLGRATWPKSRPLYGLTAFALAFEFGWLGLAMSGPIVLLLGRRGGPLPLKRDRPGRLVSHVEPPPSPIGRGFEEPRPTETPSFTRAEVAWMMIGGYWIGLTLFVVPALSIDTPWALVVLLQVVAAVGLFLVMPGRPKSGSPPESWTHPAAVGLLATWPLAWIFLILLGRSL